MIAARKASHGVSLAIATLLVCLSLVASAAGQARAGDAGSEVEAGIAALDRGDTAAARAHFEAALRIDPKNAAAHTNLGLVSDRAGDLEAASRHFAEAARLAPSAASHNNYGVILLRLGRDREAAAQFEASLGADPRQPNALVNLAQIRFASGSPNDLKVASDLLERAFAIAPDVEIARALTVIALRRSDRTAAATHYAAYAARLAESAGAPVALPAARAELGAALLESGLTREAEAELAAAVALEPANVDAIVRLARAFLARNDFPAAGRTLEGAVARGVDAAPVYALLAEVYERSGHIENAIPAMRLAIQRDPASEKYRFGYGMLLMDAYAPAAAVIRLEEALRDFPTSPRLWFALGLAHFKNDRDEEATNALDKALELDPKFAPAAAYLGMVRAKTGGYAEAIAFYERALAIDPNLAVVHYLIAEALVKEAESDTRRIEDHLSRVIAADPDFVPAHLALARLLIRTARWTDAVVELEKVVALDPNVTEAYYHLGRVYSRLKRADDARTAVATFERLSATQKEQEHAELQQVVRRLADVHF